MKKPASTQMPIRVIYQTRGSYASAEEATQRGKVFASHTGSFQKPGLILFWLTESKHENRKDQIDWHLDNEKEKKPMVAHSHAIIDPGAMVIETLHTAITESAMARPLSPDDLTIRTETTRIKLLNKMLSLDCSYQKGSTRPLQISRVSKPEYWNRNEKNNSQNLMESKPNQTVYN